MKAYGKVLCVALAATLSVVRGVHAQPAETGFTYQGQLKQGGRPLNGAVDLVFDLYDAPVGGNLLGSHAHFGAPVTKGLFTVTLNDNGEFGPNAFNGDARWLEILVDSVPMSPRQEITATPYALQTRGIFVDDTGDVGIGTTNPVWKLHVAGNVHDGIKISVPDGTDTSAQLALSAGLEPQFGQGAIFQLNAPSNTVEPNGLLVYNRTNGPLVLGTDNQHRVEITASGDVGIGTPNPVARLHVVGVTQTDGLRIPTGAAAGYVLTSDNAGIGSWQPPTGGISIPLVLSGDRPQEAVIVGANNSSQPSSAGVMGRATAATGETYGGHFRSDSLHGRGVYGEATNSSNGFAYGVVGETNSQGGAGVVGTAKAPSGATSGGFFLSYSPNGRGVYGYGPAYGGLFETPSTDGVGVCGLATAVSGLAFGVSGRSSSTAGRGVVGVTTAATGPTQGVYGRSDSTGGLGIVGFASAITGVTYGGRFESASSDGLGVYGLSSAATGATYGGRFESRSTYGIGVEGFAGDGTGSTVGGRFQSVSTNGTGVVGFASADSGTTYGGRFESFSTGGYGIHSLASANSGTTYGGWFEDRSDAGIGVFGNATAATGNAWGGGFRSSSIEGLGVYGEASAASGYTTGAWGRALSTNGTGVFGDATATTGTTYGGRFVTASSSGTAAYGRATATTGFTKGLWGRSDSPNGSGVYGEGAAASGGIGGRFRTVGPGGTALYAETESLTGQNYSVNAVSRSPDGLGVLAWNTATTGTAYGVRGVSESTTCRATVGYAPATTGQTAGVLGQADSAQGSGVVGIAASDDAAPANAGVFGQNANASPTAYAVYASGKFAATGTKSFVMDHPLDPANRILQHFCTEGPEPINTYRGRATLNANGEAVVRLPGYFEAINEDFEYELTAIGAPMPMLHIAAEVMNNAFRIAGGAPAGQVSWCVTGRRSDGWVKAYGARAEFDKPARLRGRYLNPELFVPANEVMSRSAFRVASESEKTVKVANALEGGVAHDSGEQH